MDTIVRADATATAAAADAGLRLAEIVQRIAQVRDMPSLMAIVRRAARELTGADGATLVLRDGEQCHYADEDAIGPLWKGQRFALTSCVSGWAMLNEQPAIIEDIELDPRVPYEAYRPTFVRSLCMTPIGRAPAVGAIGCYWARRQRASAAQVALQQALADATAIGIANIELYRQLVEARELAERGAAHARRSEALARATFDHAGTGVAIVALDGRWLRVNRRLCEIVGYTEQQLLALTFQDVTHAADLAGDVELVRAMLAGEIDTSTLEKRYVHRDGRLVWINLTVTLARAPDGTPDYFVAIIEDIERRKAAEEALAEERAQFRELANIAAEYFWEMDEQLKLRFVSPSIAERSGLDYRAFLGRSRWELPFVGVTAVELDAHRATLEARRPFRGFEAALPNAAGEMRWFEIHGDPKFARDGAFKGYHGVTQDITARKLVEARLRQHAMVFDNSQEGIVITDPDGCVLDANASFERITEYTLDEMRGRNMRFLQSGRHDRAFYLNLWQSLLSVGSWQGEVWNRRKGGEIYLEWISLSAVKDEAGVLLAYVGTSVDISRMNHVQSEIERLAHHDALTGLPNRLLLMSRLEHALDRVGRGGAGAVLFLDLDGFKAVNDRLGHAAGDRVLVAVASRLRARLRDADTLARLGGDEFVVVLEDVADAALVAGVADALIACVAAPIDLADGSSAQLGLSIGIAPFPDVAAEAGQLLACADRALYEAKAAGKGHYRYATR